MKVIITYSIIAFYYTTCHRVHIMYNVHAEMETVPWLMLMIGGLIGLALVVIPITLCVIVISVLKRQKVNQEIGAFNRQ